VTAKLEWARLACFVVFVVLVVRARQPAGPTTPERIERRRRRIDALLAYALAVSLAVGFTQRESWPFTNWALVHNLCPPAVTRWLEIEIVDEAGSGHVPDPVIWQPLAMEELASWMGRYFHRLDAAGQESVVRFLLSRAEVARDRLVREESIDRNAAWLGPLAAPYHFLRARIWRTAADVPSTPFSAIRIWALAWNVEDRRKDPSRVSRRVVYETNAGR
jgi:hypothetical protein